MIRKCFETIEESLANILKLFIVKSPSNASRLEHARIYLFFWDFQGFQVIAYDTEFLFKFNNFTVKREKKKFCLIKVHVSRTPSILRLNGFSYISIDISLIHIRAQPSRSPMNGEAKRKISDCCCKSSIGWQRAMKIFNFSRCALFVCISGRRIHWAD